MTTKSIFTSKTFWLNIGLAALPALIPPAQEFVAQHPDVATSLAAVLNILNRLMTNQGVYVK